MLLDSDDASEMMLAHLLAENGGVLSKEWYYSTELRVLNTQLVRIPFFFITDNWRTVRILSNMALLAIFGLSLYFYCKTNKISFLFPLLCGISFIPFSSDHFNFVLRGGYYIPHIAISFVMISLTIAYGDSNNKSLKRRFIISTATVLSFFAGLGGPRQLFIYYIPILMAVFLFYWVYRNTPVRAKRYILFTIPTTATSILGFYINNHILKKTYYFQDNDIVHYTRIWAETLFKVVNGWLINLGFCQGSSVFSTDTISNLLCATIIILCLYSVYQILHQKERYTDGDLLTVLFFSSGAFFFFFFYSCTDALFYSRYSSPFTIFMIPIIFIGITRASFRSWFKFASIGILSILIIICGIFYYKKTAENSDSEFVEIAEFLTSEGYENGYSRFWEGNVLTELSNGRINVWVWGDLMTDIVNVDEVYHWLQYTSHSLSHPTGMTYILMKTSDKYTINSYLTEKDVIYRSDNYIIYGFDTYEELHALFDNQV